MKHRKEYEDWDRDICPYCGADSSHLSWGSLEVDGTTVTQEVSCGKCGGEFYDVYEFARAEGVV
jgi:hypothetical protein